MNVISFSVWGTAPSYFYGLLDNCILIKHNLPEFTCFVYHNNSLPNNIKDVLIKLGNVRLIPMNNTNDKRNTMWRFLPAFYKNVNIPQIIPHIMIKTEAGPGFALYKAF